MEIRENNNKKLIAFYLPQYHCIPENDEAYGKGFTEWTNTKKAEPLFEGHYQPKIPLNENYYCLEDINVMKKQVDLAKEYGLYGFCFYHYWFQNGKKLLEKPIENFLKHKEINFPFCLSWANENWSRRWDGGNGEIIARQEYGNRIELKKHILYLKDFFEDPRYIRIDNKPVFLIYRPDLIPNVKKLVRYLRKEAVKLGFDGLTIMAQHPTYYIERENRDIFDYFVEFEPAYINKINSFEKKDIYKRRLERIILNVFGENMVSKIKEIVTTKQHKMLEIHNYDRDWKDILKLPVWDKKQIAGAFVDWDNTARNKNGLMYEGACPEKFKTYFEKLCKKVDEDYFEKVIFINAWNEWAEGAYLEPDEKYEYAYLQAIKDILEG